MLECCSAPAGGSAPAHRQPPTTLQYSTVLYVYRRPVRVDDLALAEGPAIHTYVRTYVLTGSIRTIVRVMVRLRLLLAGLGCVAQLAQGQLLNGAGNLGGGHTKKGQYLTDLFFVSHVCPFAVSRCLGPHLILVNR